MEILSKLFGSVARVRILRLFLYSPDQSLLTDEVAKRSKISLTEAKKELAHLTSLKFLREKKVLTKKGTVSAKRQYHLASDFPYQDTLRDLFNADFFNNRRSIVNRFKNCGRIRLMVLSGIFSHRPNAPADLVIAGDDLKKTLIDQTIKNIEAETGRDLTYAVFDSSDFMYRFHSSDRFVRDLFESSHERLIDKLALED